MYSIRSSFIHNVQGGIRPWLRYIPDACILLPQGLIVPKVHNPHKYQCKGQDGTIVQKSSICIHLQPLLTPPEQHYRHDKQHQHKDKRDLAFSHQVPLVSCTDHHEDPAREREGRGLRLGSKASKEVDKVSQKYGYVPHFMAKLFVIEVKQLKGMDQRWRG